MGPNDKLNFNCKLEPNSIILWISLIDGWDSPSSDKSNHANDFLISGQLSDKTLSVFKTFEKGHDKRFQDKVRKTVKSWLDSSFWPTSIKLSHQSTHVKNYSMALWHHTSPTITRQQITVGITLWNNDLCVEHKRNGALKVGHMVEKRRTSSTERNRRNMRSPLSLPPRWGEGVAPPTTPHYTQENTPETSPRTDLFITDHRVSSPDSDYNSQPGSLRASTMPRLNQPSASYPSTGAELLEDLHRRLQAQSINGTLPRRPKSTSLQRHRKNRKTRHKMNCNPQPDLLLPTSAFNHPSRHTQYHLVQLPSSTSSHNLQPQPTSHTLASLSRPLNEPPTSDYSPSPSTSESPPLPATSLSYPSPPILRKLEKQPLTSTMLGSPPESSSSGSHITTGHPTSPASPEISSIPQRPQDRTTYQNIENGIVYITAEQAHNIQQASTSSLPVRSSIANLSRFNVSPPHNPTVSCKSGIRLPAKNKLKAKTVSWVADRKVKAKNISEDRKIVKSQVQIE